MALRIPKYTSQLAPTSDAPGRSISARMSPSAVAQAELAKSAPASALIQSVGAYAKMRYNAEQELLLNEGLLEAEEGIRQAAYDLEREKKLSNVFGGDNMWKSQTEDLRTQVLDKIGTNRFTRQKFMDRFDQMELTSRFQLKDVIDRKIEAAAQASLARRQETTVTELSQNIYQTSAMIDLYNQKVGGIEGDIATGVKQKRYSENGAAIVTSKMKIDIAKNVVGAYVSTTPSYALGLLEALEVQDLLDAGIEVDVEDRPVLDGGSYALHTLQNIPRDDAINIIKDALTEAAAFQKVRDEAQEKNEKANEKLLKSQSAELDELMLTIDPLKIFSLEDAQTGTEAILGEGFEFNTTDTGRVSGAEILTQLRQWAFENLDVTEQKNKFYLARINGADLRPTISQPLTMEMLTKKEILGTLTFADVDSASAVLTSADQQRMYQAVRNNQDRGVTRAKTNIRNSMKYDANLLQTMDKGAAEKITNEISNLYRQLDTEVDRRRAAGEPMTQQQVIDLGNKLISEAPGIRDILDEEYENAITDATFQNLLSDIITQAETFSQEQRPAEIIKLIDKMNEQEDVAENKKNASKSLRLQMLDLKKRYEGLAR
tara:strand:+ start:3205 stop:5010 length:1806 start_codon:yes stop_codon:yes gene_type:complete